MEVTLHIGWHKTGSTSLQLFLFHNRDALVRQHRVWYPPAGPQDRAHHTLAWMLLGRKTSAWGPVPELAGGAEGYVRAAGDDARARGCTKVIFSSEDFCVLDRDGIERLAASLRGIFSVVRVVAYVRRQDLQIESAYNMEVRWWGTRVREEFDEYASVRAIGSDYASVLDQWSRAFGVSNLAVRAYDRRLLADGDVRADFCRTAGIGSDGLQFARETANDSLGPRTLETMRVLNNLDIATPVHEHIAARLHAWDAANHSPRCVLFEPGPRRAYVARHAASNERLRSYGLDPVPLTLGSDALPERNVTRLTPEVFAEMFSYLASTA